MTFSAHIPTAAHGRIGVAFTDRFGGWSSPPFDSFNLGRTGIDTPHCLESNYRLLGALVHCDKIAICSQMHGTDVVVVDGGYPFVGAGTFLDPDADPHPRADGMVTRETGVALVIRAADCVPVLFADSQARVIGAAHAGRVSLLGGVLEKTVGSMLALGAKRLRAWIGPHVCPSCYEVPEEMARAAWEKIPACRSQSGRGTAAIDLGAGVEEELAAHDVQTTRLDPCTSCDPRFFSHRRDKGNTGRQGGVIWLNP